MILVLFLLLAGVLPFRMDFDAAVLYLTETDVVENIPQEVYEQYRQLADHPLDINNCSRSKLMSSPLFTPFQAASLLDYRSRGGDILSFTELSLVDGFSEELCKALTHFVILKSTSPPSQTRYQGMQSSLMLRSLCKEGFHYSGKMHAEYADKLELNYSFKDGFSPQTISVGLRSPDDRWGLFLGDYSARFGQGLLLWSGFAMTGFNSLQSFRRNATGLSATTSFTRGTHGLALQYGRSHNQFSILYSYPKLMALNYRHLSLRSSYGATLLADYGGMFALAADCRIGLPSLSISAEYVAQYSAPGLLHHAAMTSMVWTPRYGIKTALLGRYYQAGYQSLYGMASSAFSSHSDEGGLALYFQSPAVLISIDCATRLSEYQPQCKALAQLSRQCMLPFSLTLTSTLRSATRYRPLDDVKLKEDLRLDLSLNRGELFLNTRYNVQWHKGMSYLVYFEPSWKGERLSASLRYARYNAPTWDDRIYCYEKDIPGYFYVPACYGDGWSLYALAGYKFIHKRFTHRLSFKASIARSDRGESKEMGRSELKLQYQLLFF